MDISYNNKCSVQLLKVLEQFNLIKQSIKDTIKLNIDLNKDSIKILDIGSSHGYNSNIELILIIDIIRNEMKLNKLIEVYHCDQESNNFNQLFNYINNSNESYLNRYSNMYSYGKGRSFIYQLLPNESCDIIYSFYTFHWVDLNDTLLLNYEIKSKDNMIISKQSTASYNQFTYNHLNNILKHRYNELRVGGTFIFNLCIKLKDRTDQHYNVIKDIFRLMANEGLITHDEVDNMFVPCFTYNIETVDKLLNEWSSKGLQVKEKAFTYMNWGEQSIESVAKIQNKPKDQVTHDEFINYYVESTLGYCGPSIKNAIKGNQDRINHIYDLFKSRFILKLKQNDNCFNIIFGSLFIVMTKQIK